MSRWFILAIGALQLGACASKAWRGDWAMATVWLGYFVANVGLLMAR